MQQRFCHVCHIIHVIDLFYYSASTYKQYYLLSVTVLQCIWADYLLSVTVHQHVWVVLLTLSWIPDRLRFCWNLVCWFMITSRCMSPSYTSIWPSGPMIEVFKLWVEFLTDFLLTFAPVLQSVCFDTCIDIVLSSG